MTARLFWHDVYGRPELVEAFRSIRLQFLTDKTGKITRGVPFLLIRTGGETKRLAVTIEHTMKVAEHLRAPPTQATSCFIWSTRTARFSRAFATSSDNRRHPPEAFRASVRIPAPH
jgi:hypothetical protein